MQQNDKPWLLGNRGAHAKFYGLWYGRNLANAIYSPGLDRFLLIDGYDLWLTLETARVLSSKLPTQVFLLGKDVLEFDNKNCLEYAVFNKKDMAINDSMVGRQFPGVSPLLEKNSVYHAGWPVDYTATEKRVELANLRNYAFFCLRAVYAAKIADALRNDLPLSEILSNVGCEDLAQGLSLPTDYSDASIGLKKSIMRILYLSKNEDEALASIEDLWLNDGKNLPNFRDTFHYVLGLEASDKAKNASVDYDGFTRRAV
jgi:hypothetical protein